MTPATLWFERGLNICLSKYNPKVKKEKFSHKKNWFILLFFYFCYNSAVVLTPKLKDKLYKFNSEISKIIDELEEEATLELL